MRLWRKTSRAADILALLIFVGVLAGSVPPAQGHHLNGYLQSTLIMVGPEVIELEIYLSPGMDVAPGIIQLIDTDRNGTASSSEVDNYGRAALKEMSLELDSVPIPLNFESIVVPAFDEFKTDEGFIALKAKGSVAHQSGGAHRLVFKNQHQPKFSAYLVNALVPDVKSIELTGLSRSQSQDEFRLDYIYKKAGFAEQKKNPRRLWPLVFMGLGLAIAAVYFFNEAKRRVNKA